MKFYKVKERLDDLRKLEEWTQYATTPENTRLSDSNFRPNDEYYKNMIQNLILYEITRLENAEVDV